jgi:hypothetical protein
MSGYPLKDGPFVSLCMKQLFAEAYYDEKTDLFPNQLNCSSRMIHMLQSGHVTCVTGSLTVNSVNRSNIF